MVKIKKQLVNKSIRNELSYGKGNKLSHDVQHETANEAAGATAQMHANLQSGGNSREASWHFTVDDKQIIQSFPVSYRCWHAGGSYNNHSIGIELCVNDKSKFKKAAQNAAELNKHLMNKHNIPASNLVTHKHASGWKPCPRHLLNNDWGISWNEFKKSVNSSDGKIKKTKAKKPTAPKTSGNLGLVDWMNKQGMDSGQNNRKKLAAEYGVKGYDFSAQKNIALLNALKKGKPTKNKKAKIKKGAKVTLSNSAKTYATGQSIPASVKGEKYTVQQVKKNRVLLKEIYSWVNSHDIVVNGSSSGTPKTSKKKVSKKIKKGATVTLKKSASNYTTGQSIPASVKDKKYTVQQVKGNKVLLKQIYSWVEKSDVSGGSSGGGKSVKQMAKEIINGKGIPQGHEARRKHFGISKKKYEKVRKKVNQML